MRRILSRLLPRILDRLFDRIEVSEKFDAVFAWFRAFTKRIALIYTDNDKQNAAQMKELWQEERMPLAKSVLDELEEHIRTDRIPDEDQAIALESIQIVKEYLKLVEDEDQSTSA